MSDESSNNPSAESKNQPTKDWGKLGLRAGFVGLGVTVIGLLSILLIVGASAILPSDEVIDGLLFIIAIALIFIMVVIIAFGASLAGIIMSVKGARKAARSRNTAIIAGAREFTTSKNTATLGIILNAAILFPAIIVITIIIIGSIPHKNDYLYGMDFSPDGEFLATGWTNGEIRILDTETGKRIQTLKGHTEEVDFISYSPDGTILTSASRDNAIRFWDTATNKEIHSLNLDYGWFRAMAFQSATNQLMVVTQEKGIVMIDTTTYEISDMISLGEFSMVLFSPDGSLIGINKDFESPDLYIRNMSSFDQQVTLTNVDNKTDQFAFSPNAELVAVSLQDLDKEMPGGLQVWNLESKKTIYSKKLDYSSEQVLNGYSVTLAFSPDSEKLAYTSGDYFNLLNIETQEVVPFEASNDNKRFHVSEIAFSPDGTRIAANITDYVIMWDATNGKLLWQYPVGNWLDFFGQFFR